MLCWIKALGLCQAMEDMYAVWCLQYTLEGGKHMTELMLWSVMCRGGAGRWQRIVSTVHRITHSFREPAPRSSLPILRLPNQFMLGTQRQRGCTEPLVSPLVSPSFPWGGSLAGGHPWLSRAQPHARWHLAGRCPSSAAQPAPRCWGSLPAAQLSRAAAPGLGLQGSF